MEYDGCPKGLSAEHTSFESLQCGISACAGVVGNQTKFEESCKSCEHYVINRYQKDVEEDAQFLAEQRRTRAQNLSMVTNSTPVSPFTDPNFYEGYEPGNR